MESGSPGQYEGYIVDILNSLASQNNFTYSIVPEPDGVYGVKDDKGNWNGMMGNLVSKVRLRFAFFWSSLGGGGGGLRNGGIFIMQQNFSLVGN